jgi:multicomponent Na+:H+ antiporter subunit C
VSPALVYALAGVLLFCLGAYALLACAHLLRKILALNIMASGTFLALVGLAQRAGAPDPVPHALVLTGIVVAVSSTALALVLARRLYDATGATTLEEDRAR